jgi:hypothetical protein
MKNEIISELRRIRDSRAAHHNHDVEAMARDLIKLDPWMEKKAVVIQHGRLVPMASLQRRSPHRALRVSP